MKRKVLIIAMSIILCFSILNCTLASSEKPGDISNSTLVALFNKTLESELAMMSNPDFHPDYQPEAEKNARIWLSEIKSLESRCTGSTDDNSKSNKFVYDITLVDGTSIKDIYTGIRCLYMYKNSKPNIMHIEMESGKIIDIKTDGRERENPVDFMKAEALRFSKIIIDAGIKRDKNKFYSPKKAKEDIKKEWEVNG